MVQRVLNIVYKEIRGLHQAAYILAIFTFGSQLLGLIRDRLFAHNFGAGIETDLYYTAFRIPDFLYVIFASTLSVYVLIPFISRRMEESSVARAQQFLSQIFSLFLVGYSFVALGTIVLAPYIVSICFPGFAEHAETLVTLIRILMLQPLLLGISSLLGVITQMQHRYVLYAVSPLIYNLGIIGGLLFLYPHFGLYGLAYGVLIGALGHVCVQVPFIAKSALAPRFTLSFAMDDIVAVCRTSITRAVTLSLHQLVLLVLVGFASVMAVGSVSVFQYSLNLQSVPLAIIGMSYSVAAFPLLAQLYAEKKFDEFGKNIVTTIRHILFWAFPVITLLIVIRAQFVRVILGSGAFDWNDTRLTAAILAICIVSLAAQSIHLLVVRALYAVGNTRLPLYVTLFSSVVIFVFAFGFYALLSTYQGFYTLLETVMRLKGVDGIEVLALPLAYSSGLILHSLIMLICARRLIFISLRTIVRPILQATIASLSAGYLAYTVLNFVAHGSQTDTLMAVFAQGACAAIIGMVGYVCVQHMFKCSELYEIYRTLGRRFSKADVIVPQDEDHLAV